MFTVIGIGIQNTAWRQFTHAIQAHLPHQKMEILLVERESLDSKYLVSTCENLVARTPALVILSWSAFSQEAHWHFFLSRLFLERESLNLRIAVMEGTTFHDAQPFFDRAPKITLINQMHLKVSDAGTLISSPLKTFPRIQVDGWMDGFELYHPEQDPFFIELSQLPENTFISSNQIHRIYQGQQSYSFQQWAILFLKKPLNTISLSQVKGLLKEKKGCFVFPGIPIDRIASMELPGIQIDYLLQSEMLGPESVAFRRLIAHGKEYKAPLTSIDLNQKPIRYLSHLPILNHAIKQCSQQLGLPPAVCLEQFPTGTHVLTDSCFWIRCTRFPKSRFLGPCIDWYESLQNWLRPLRFFVKLPEMPLMSLETIHPMSLEEFEEKKGILQKQEKLFLQKSRQSQNHLILLQQEEQIVLKAADAARRLTACLSHHLFVEEVFQHQNPLDQKEVLLLVEDQEMAMELSQHLFNIPKKLWINPLQYEGLDQLSQTDLATFERYSENGVIVVTASGLKSLEALMYQALKSSESIVWERSNHEKQAQAHQFELDKTLHKKNELAYQWIYSGIKQLLSSLK